MSDVDDLAKQVDAIAKQVDAIEMELPGGLCGYPDLELAFGRYRRDVHEVLNTLVALVTNLYARAQDAGDDVPDETIDRLERALHVARFLDS